MKTFKVFVKVESLAIGGYNETVWVIKARNQESARKKAYTRMGYRDGEILHIWQEREVQK